MQYREHAAGEAKQTSLMGVILVTKSLPDFCASGFEVLNSLDPLLAFALIRDKSSVKDGCSSINTVKVPLKASQITINGDISSERQRST